MAKTSVLQGSLFARDYLVRTLGPLATIPDVALTELVANAWDAGASRVEITIPDKTGGELVVSDDGTGMTHAEFRRRWLTLGYNRISVQGHFAEFPLDRRESRRRAYGRFGLGRHGMLCFTDSYAVETMKDGDGHRFWVSATEGEAPFALFREEPHDRGGHGTTLRAIADRNVPQASRIRDVLAGRFLHDPQFILSVNGESVALEDHEGLVTKETLSPTSGVTLRIVVVDSTKMSRRMAHHGVAFWVGNRLVGEPSWIVGDRALADGRTSVARRHTIIVRTDDLFDHVLPDWSGFQRDDVVVTVMAMVTDYVEKLMRDLHADRVEETKRAVLRKRRESLSELRPLGRREVLEFVNRVAQRQPTISADLLAAAVDAVINLEKSRSGASLLQKLSQLAEDDVEGLDQLLDEWTVRDALTVLDEIDRRIAVIEALERLSADTDVDELHTLHPLITQARWLFGPQYDSPLYSSNMTLRKAAEAVFKKRVADGAFTTPRRRPDLVMLADSTISIVGSESEDRDTRLFALTDVLIIEVKRGGARIGRKDLQQAQDYVEAFLHSGILDGTPNLRAFVVGHAIADKVERVRRVGDPPKGRIDGCTFGQLVRTAHRRLFRLRDELAERYGDATDADLFNRAMPHDVQLQIASPVNADASSNGSGEAVDPS